ncbi:hypothetical protein MLD38_015556 [Melastoma candidum]|uniref:Uncharacterized protein n=1 Tax=Melastoma candidum TaxID=119954 RepID=A0ACB9RGI8_9MYRT|nr:hypothetical protein MLD38_015556 [Melastoma candidum]
MARTTTKLLSPVLLLLLLFLCSFVDGAAKRRIHITDDLEDVVDDEEDDVWKQWGMMKKENPPDDEFDPPPDFSGMDFGRIQDEMMRRHSGPTFGFVKLRLGGGLRTRDDVTGIAMKWTKVLKTGAVEANFMAVDLSTIMFTMTKGQDTLEVKEFLLDQPEAYEVKIGDRVFRRPGDPPLEEVVERLRREKGIPLKGG